MSRRKTPEALIDGVTRKLLRRVEEALDADWIAPGDLDKLSDVVKEAAAVLGVIPALDADEQRAKIRVLLRRADGADERDSELRISFDPDVEACAR